jgi:hypothetical protein
MSYNTVAEIYEAIDESRSRLLASVESLGAGQEHFRPDPERWSIADIVEHLSLVEGQIARLFHVMLSKAEAAGAEGDADAAFAAPVSIEHFVEALREKKLQSPDGARPGGQLSLADALARLHDSRAALHTLRPRLERIDGTALRYPHPAAGPIDIYQWLLFVGSHEDRHRLQIEALKQSPGFAANDE